MDPLEIIKNKTARQNAYKYSYKDNLVFLNHSLQNGQIIDLTIRLRTTTKRNT